MTGSLTAAGLGVSEMCEVDEIDVDALPRPLCCDVEGTSLQCLLRFEGDKSSMPLLPCLLSLEGGGLLCFKGEGSLVDGVPLLLSSSSRYWMVLLTAVVFLANLRGDWVRVGGLRGDEVEGFNDAILFCCSRGDERISLGGVGFWGVFSVP